MDYFSVFSAHSAGKKSSTEFTEKLSLFWVHPNNAYLNLGREKFTAKTQWRKEKSTWIIAG
jgi:hypothetical protein